MNWSADEVGEVTPAVVTVTSTLTAAVLTGLVTVICVPAELICELVIGTTVVPKFTAVAPVKPAPEIVTVVPPAKGPSTGLTPVTRGALRFSEASVVLVPWVNSTSR